MTTKTIDVKAKDLKAPCRLLAVGGYRLPETQGDIVSVRRGPVRRAGERAMVLLCGKGDVEHSLYPDTICTVELLRRARDAGDDRPASTSHGHGTFIFCAPGRCGTPMTKDEEEVFGRAVDRLFRRFGLLP